MDRHAKFFVQGSMIYLIIGAVLGVMMAVHEDWTFLLSSAHAHINLVGFVTFMIFGVGYHILPRFTGRPLHSVRLANTHLWLANIGLGGMALFWVLDGGFKFYTFQIIGMVFSIVLGVSMVIFVYNMWKSLIPLPQGE
jgi:cytochrome c oxidase cbb3-type subunit 1